MVGFSQEKPWLPDDDTAAALASLMAVCASEYGIPLQHPWPDGDFGKAGKNPHRSSGKYGSVPGWYGHGGPTGRVALARPKRGSADSAIGTTLRET